MPTMPTDAADDRSLHRLNARMADNYDRVPYDEPASPGLDPEKVFALAARYGAPHGHTNVDVLDLGCGSGAQLERAASLTEGRAVGTDLSERACEKAAARTVRFGSRCRVLRADFMDLEAEALGRFDLIYNIGVLYVAPPAVRTHVLALIADCLRPGGVAVISYCTGTIPLLKAGLHRVLRSGTDETASPEEQVRAARSRLETIGGTIAEHGGDHRLIASVLHHLSHSPDTVFFHEMLNGRFEPLATSELEAALGARGVHFLNWMNPAPFDPAASPQQRAMIADAYALAGGGYVYGVFRKDLEANDHR
jgi:SAM-dependent methyltransferase